ncbi:MAG TPA: NADP-dependent oxidoreductase [Rubrobacter sp.]|nr:NADP-dependent oxidoreductase [Rubrobacter sp.]
MRAITLESFDRGPQLHEVPTPQIGPDEVLIRVHASSINALDVKIAAGMLRGMLEYKFPVTIGRDLAGVVEQVGSEVSRYRAGEEVFGFLGFKAEPVLHEGSFADYVASPEDMFVAPKPPGLDFLEAGVLPLAGIAALISIDVLDPSEGERVLIVGATGGVGSYAMQLAAGRGAHVIATAWPEDEEYVRDLGAAETIHYTQDDVVSEIRERYPEGVEGLVDLINFADGFAQLAEVVAPGGRAASLLGAADAEQLAARDITATNVVGTADPALLTQLAELVASGALRVPDQRVFSLEEATEGLDAFEREHTRGKLAISVATA